MNASRATRILFCALLTLAIAGVACTAAPIAHAQVRLPVSPKVSGSYIVVFREGVAAQSLSGSLNRSALRVQSQHTHLGTAAVQMTAANAAALAADPAVERVIPDQVVVAHALLRQSMLASETSPLRVKSAGPLRSIMPDAPAAPTSSPTGGSSSGTGTVGSGDGSGTSSTGTGSTGTGSGTTTSPTPQQTADTFYTASPQGWAVRASGGYGAGFLGGTAAGPWNRTLGTGVRIAILDSGIDRAHPDLANNLGLNLSEIDIAAQPSQCDDGSPQDQQGHGTWVASLAAGAIGPNTGRVAGVAPSATLLNIKVLQRTPGAGSTLAARCASGQATGLVSWLLKGIDDAVTQHADVIVLSLGSIVDLYTGDGAGMKAAFDRATHAAANAGALVIAAAGNDAFDLSNPEYLELPAQARDVLAIVASTNPDCAENNRSGASCAAGAVTVPYYSNYGAPLNAVAAPGGNYPVAGDEAVSGWVRGACSNGLPGTSDGVPADASHSFGCFDLGHQGYVQAMGTSASAGLAAGAAALLRAAHPSWTPAQTANALRGSTHHLDHGAVLLDTLSALNAQP